MYKRPVFDYPSVSSLAGFLETQLKLIEKVGLPNCLQSQMGDLS